MGQVICLYPFISSDCLWVTNKIVLQHWSKKSFSTVHSLHVINILSTIMSFVHMSLSHYIANLQEIDNYNIHQCFENSSAVSTN